MVINYTSTYHSLYTKYQNLSFYNTHEEALISYVKLTAEKVNGSKNMMIQPFISFSPLFPLLTQARQDDMARFHQQGERPDG
jgi:hypothetical protein